MHVKLSSILASIALMAAATMAAPAVAQSVNDFTLPPSQPEEQPEAQGPADDSGLVPVGPRVIADEAPNSPAETVPTPQPAEPTRPEETAGEQATNPAAPRPAPSASVPIPSTTGSQPPEAAPQSSDQAVQPQVEPFEQAPSASDALTFPPSVAEQDSTEAEPSAEGSTPQWLWLAGGGALVLLLALGGLTFWRRSKAQHVPIIERPVVGNAADQDAAAAVESKVELDVEVVGLSRSFMTLTLNCRICMTNRSDRAARDLTLSADLASAHRAVPMEQQLAMPDTGLTERTQIERIGPHQMRAEQLSLQIPVAELNAFKQGDAALCVPLLRMRMTGASSEPKLRTFAIGIDPGTPAARLQPIPLHVPPGSYPAARARPLD